MDWIREPFEVDARLLLGAGAPLARLRWVFTDQPFLPVGTGSVVNNRMLNEDYYSDLPIGQVQPVISNYEQDARWRLPAGMPVGHRCHPEWFPTGEPWPNDLPPNVYGPFWIPECCGLFQDQTEGGCELGGEVAVVFSTAEPTEGGMELGGEVTDVYSAPEPTEGGMELGGEVTDVYSAPEPTEGGMELGGEVTDVYDIPEGEWIRDERGDYTFTAVHTGDHLLKLYGGGGRGGPATSPGGIDTGGGGGGGGAEANAVLSLTFGTSYLVRVGAGGDVSAADGSETWFKIGSTIVVLAAGADAAVDNVGGAGGTGGSSIGDVVWSGGLGADGQATADGGGGGSSAAFSPTGTPPGTGGDATGSTGGTPPYGDGGTGGNGGASGVGGGAGGAPGGGGGGAGASATDPPGDGHDGKIVIVWPP